MPQAFIGRKKELQILLNALHSDEPEMAAVIGRRRVGKTFLVRTAKRRPSKVGAGTLLKASASNTCHKWKKR